MDLICLILWIIDLFKPSISLSIAVIVTGVIDLLLLCHQKKKMNLAYAVSIAGVIIGTYKICVL